MMLSLIYLFPILISSVVSSSEFIYPKGLPCKVHNRTALDCSNRKLTNIPLLTEDNVKSLDLSYNQLETVNGTSFIHLTSLHELDLSNNSVMNICFETHLSLRLLDLSYNRILNISTDTFTGLDKLETLDLSHQHHLPYTHLTMHGSPFLSTTALKRLDIAHSDLHSPSPSVFDGLHALQELDISGNPIYSTTSVFTGLTNLTHLDTRFLDNTLAISTPDFFKDLTSLKYLDLAVCSISSISGTLFENLTSLQHLNLSTNSISRRLPETVFVNLTSLQHLNLSTNSISRRLPETVFVNLISLQHLDLSWNYILSLPETLFVNLTNITYLDISRNGISSLPETLFVTLTSLQHLDLSDNLIPCLPETSFVGLTHLIYLDISWTSMTSTPCKALEGLQMLSTLDMHGNHFDYVTCSIGNMTSLKELFVSYSKQSYGQQYTEYWNETKWSELITRLPASISTLHLEVYWQSVFQSVKAPSLLNSSVSSLQIFYCRFLGYLPIEDDAFSMFPNLQNLSIENCYDYNGNTLNVSKYAFRNLIHLKTLDLSKNSLTEFPSEELRVLADSLKHLNLSNNNIQNLFNYNQNISLQLESLDVSHNPISELNLHSLGYVTDVHLNDIISEEIWMYDINTALRSIDISPDKKICTVYYAISMPLCTIAPGLKEITFNKLYFLNNTYQFLWGQCSHLISLAISDSKGNIFEKQQLSHFPHLENLALTNCSLSSIDQFLLESRDLRYLDLSNNNIVSLLKNQFHHMPNLTYLNFAGNKFASLSALRGLHSLQTLIVSVNLLTTLPTFLMKTPYHLLYVDFGNNSFTCTCDIEPLQDWILRDKRTYIDPKHWYMCQSPADYYGLGITRFSLDCSTGLHPAYNILISTLSGLIVILVIAATIYKKYRWRIHYRFWVLFYQRRYQRYVDNDDDADIMNSDDEDDVDADHRYEAPIMRRQYHAYVAYHRESQAWIDDQLIRVIEDGQEQFRLCLKERGDIPAGHYILNAICHGISKSRKTIAILSENFMDDGWCHYQLQIAQMRLVRENDDVLILVQIGEIPDDKKTMLLRQILRNKEVLKWTEDPIGQELFWNQLRMELRKPARVDRRFEEV
ncbi:uncharacterized protein [Amphiura filiformis]|uniref:uncharacterized protein n=1 Tax=Amphiura filiformis TaxID=82378 RepID=UPI003B21734D